MTEPLTISSQDPGATLQLRAYDRDYIVVELRRSGLQAAARVGTYMSDGLGDFFGQLADDWRGWTGEREWESLEGELRLRAEADRTGHVYLRIRLQGGAPDRWTVDALLVLEAGQLQRMAMEARAFEQSAMRGG